jgi:hypothetical protein
MPKLILITLLNSLIIMTGGGSVYAQKPPQNVQQDAIVEKTATQPEAPKQAVTIAINNGLLSVDIVNASLGETIQSIAQRAGFSIEGSSNGFGQKISTKFNDLEVDIGIIRLFSLVKENNYLINYDTEGSISKLKVYDSGTVGISGINTGAVGSALPALPPTTGTGAIPFKTWRSRRVRPSRQPAVPPPSPAPSPQASQPETPAPQPETPVQEEQGHSEED